MIKKPGRYFLIYLTGDYGNDFEMEENDIINQIPLVRAFIDKVESLIIIEEEEDSVKSN